MNLNPSFPIRSDHRAIQVIMALALGSSALFVSSEAQSISDAFIDGGGSWLAFFRGDSDSHKRLRDIVLRFHKEKRLTRKET